MKNTQTDVFNARLYVEGMKRLRVIALAVAILSLTVSVLIPVVRWISEAESYQNRLDRYEEELRYYNIAPETTVDQDEKPSAEAPPYRLPQKPTIIQTEIDSAELCAPLYGLPFLAPFFFLVLFSFLHKRKQSDFYHAIPYTRTCVYNSFVCAALTVILLIQVASVSVAGILYALCPYTTFAFTELLSITAVSFLSAAFLSGFMMLALTLTGTSTSCFFLFALFASITRIVLGFFYLTIEECIDIYQPTMASFLSPYWYLPIRMFVASEYTENLPSYLGVVLYTLVATAALYALAGFCYKVRRSEMAERPAPSRAFQHLFRCLITLPFAVLVAMYLLIPDTEFSVFLVLIAIVLVVYYLYELLTTRRIRNLPKATPYLGYVVAGAVLFASAFGLFNVYIHRELNPDKIVAVSMHGNHHGSVSYEELIAGSVLCPDEEVVDLALDAYHEFLNSDPGRLHAYPLTRVYISFHTEGGKEIRRTFYMHTKNYTTFTESLTSYAAYGDAYYSLPPFESIQSVDVYLNSVYELPHQYLNFYQHNSSITSMQALLDVFQAEYETLTKEEKNLVKQDALGWDQKVKLENDTYLFHLNLSGRIEDRYFYGNYVIPPCMPKTIEYLMKRVDADNGLQYYTHGDISHSGTALDVTIPFLKDVLAGKLEVGKNPGYEKLVVFGYYGCADTAVIKLTEKIPTEHQDLLEKLLEVCKKGEVQDGVYVTLRVQYEDGTSSLYTDLFLHISKEDFDTLKELIGLK